jgi:signal transduction histidine kinase
VTAVERATEKGSVGVVMVEDEGPGIPEMERERVFEPFYRMETSRSRATGGVGLGLSVVRGAVRAHGGDIALINRPEGGLCATVTLPGTRFSGVGD